MKDVTTARYRDHAPRRPWGGLHLVACAVLITGCVEYHTVAVYQRILVHTPVHRDGQTFITWKESPDSRPGDRYRVYRDTTGGGLAQADRIAEVPTNSGEYYREWHRSVRPHPDFHQRRFIIESGGDPLPEGTGLLVVTPHAVASTRYAVSLVRDGHEYLPDSASWSSAIQEVPSETRPVLVWASADSVDRIYTQFMDGADWNAHFEGIAYNFGIRVPISALTKPTPLTVVLHGWAQGERGYTFPSRDISPDAILLFVDDINCTWYYGFSIHAGGEKKLDGRSDTIRNYTEERIMHSIRYLLHHPSIRVDADRITAFGQSMGGTGALGLGLHYGNVFAAVYCSEPMANWISSGAGSGQNWLPDVQRLWGPVHGKAVILNRGPWSEPLRRWDGLNVWKWTNRIAMATELGRIETAFLGIAHGWHDRTIDPETQAQPLYRAFSSAGIPFSARMVDAGHEWLEFDNLPTNWNIHEHRFRRSEPLPTFIQRDRPGNTSATRDQWNHDIEWSSSSHSFDGPPVDTDSLAQISVRSKEGLRDVTLVLRRLRRFIPRPGEKVRWRVERARDSLCLTRGDLVMKEGGLLQIPLPKVDSGGLRLIFVRGTHEDEAELSVNKDSK